MTTKKKDEATPSAPGGEAEPAIARVEQVIDKLLTDGNGELLVRPQFGQMPTIVVLVLIPHDIQVDLITILLRPVEVLLDPLQHLLHKGGPKVLLLVVYLTGLIYSLVNRHALLRCDP